MNAIIAIIVPLVKKPINADYFALTDKIETTSKAPKFKVNDKVKITKYNNIFSKCYIEI